MPYQITSSRRRALLQTHTAAYAWRPGHANDTQVQSTGAARKLLQAASAPNALAWLDITGDGDVTSLDSDAFFGICSKAGGCGGSAASTCDLLAAIYSPSSVPTATMLETSLSDSSFTSSASDAWRAADPMQRYLHNVTEVSGLRLPPDTQCYPRLPASQSTPLLERFDASQPVSQAQLTYLAKGSGVSYPAAINPGEQDFKLYQVRPHAVTNCTAVLPDA